MADSSRELVGPDITAAVSFESYRRFIKGGFQDYEGLGIKRSTVDSKHVPSVRLRLRGNKVFRSFPQKMVEFLELCDASGDHSKLRPRGPRGTPRLAFRSGEGVRVLLWPIASCNEESSGAQCRPLGRRYENPPAIRFASE